MASHGNCDLVLVPEHSSLAGRSGPGGLRAALPMARDSEPQPAPTPGLPRQLCPQSSLLRASCACWLVSPSLRINFSLGRRCGWWQALPPPSRSLTGQEGKAPLRGPDLCGVGGPTVSASQLGKEPASGRRPCGPCRSPWGGEAAHSGWEAVVRVRGGPSSPPLPWCPPPQLCWRS